MTILELGQYAGAITAVLILGGLLIKWLVVIPIKAYIEKMTYAIQPHANGGSSLPDVAKTMREIQGDLCDVKDRLQAVEDFVTKKPATRAKSKP